MGSDLPTLRCRFNEMLKNLANEETETSIKQVVPDAAPDSDGSHLPVLGKSKQKT